MTGLTVYELIGEEMKVLATPMSKSSVSINILNENGDVVYNETSHLNAWDSFVDIAKQVIDLDSYVQKQLNKLS